MCVDLSLHRKCRSEPAVKIQRFTLESEWDKFEAEKFQIRTPPERERQLGKSVRCTFGDSRSAIIEAVKFQSPEDSSLGYFSKYV